MTLSVRTDRRLLPTGPARRRLLIELRAPQASSATQRPPLNLALVLDRSGSMKGAKLDVTLNAAARSLQVLGSQDQFSVVLYNDSVTVFSPVVRATPAAVAEVMLALRGVTASGNTDLAAGWLSGCAQIGAALDDDALARCLLLSDGLANRGITNTPELTQHARELRRRGVSTSTLGVGEDFDEELLLRLAEAGGGRFYFAPDESQIEAFVSAEVGSILETVAREVVLRVRAAPGVRVESLNGDPCHAVDGSFRIELGSLRSGEQCRRALTLDFPAGALGTSEQVFLELLDPDDALRKQATVMVWERAVDVDCNREAEDREVAFESARLEVALTRMRALDDQRRGNYVQAYERLNKLADALRSDSSGDAAILGLARELDQEMASYRTPTGKLVMKRRYFGNYNAIKFGEPAVGLVRAPGQRQKLYLCAVEREVSSAVEDAYRMLAPLALSWGIEGVIESFRPTCRTGRCLTEEEELALIRSLDHAPHVTIAFMDTAHHDNWFSHWHTNERVALVSLHDWASISSLPRAAFAAYEMILHGLRAASHDYEPAQFMHYETRGCLFDFCPEKQDVEIKLQAGHICQSCITRLTDIYVDPTALGRVWSAVQQLAHPQPTVQTGK